MIGLDESIDRVEDPAIREALRAMAEATAERSKDPRWAAEVQRREAAAAMAARQLEVRREAWLRSRGIPQKHLDTIIAGDLVETTALAAVKRWLPAGGVAVLVGPPDASKSFAASWAVAQDPPAGAPRYDRGRSRGWPPDLSPVFVQAELLVRIVDHRRRWEDEDAREPTSGRSVEEVLGAYLLALDDLGQEAARRDSKVADAVDIVIRTRCDRGLRTVITTNHRSIEAMARSLGGRGPRVAERLLEYGTEIACPFEGLRDARRRREALARRG